MRTINIIACGPSAELWDGQGESLGVNDCEKTGKPVQKLLVVDFPKKFPPERFRIIQDSKADFYTQLTAWMEHKDKFNLISISRWRGYLKSGQINYSLTSPFVAISLAWHWGYQEIILWGIDMHNRRTYHNEEVANMKELIKNLNSRGVKVYLGAAVSALDFLEVKPI